MFSGGAWVGESADAAETAYRKAASAKFDQAEIATGCQGPHRACVERCRAHETQDDRGKRCRAPRGRGVSRERQWPVDRGRGGYREQASRRRFKRSPPTCTPTSPMTPSFYEPIPAKPGRRRSESRTSGRRSNAGSFDRPADPPAPGPPGSPSPSSGREWRRTRPDASTPGPAGPPQLPGGPISGHSSDGGPHPGHGPLTSLLGAGTGLPSLPRRWWRWVSVVGLPGVAGWFGRFSGRGYATDGGVDFGGDSAGGAVVGDGFRSRFGCGCYGGGCGSACAASTNDSVRGPSGERPDISGAGSSVRFLLPTPAPLGAVSAPGDAGRWLDALWVGVAARLPLRRRLGSAPAPPSIPAEGGGGSSAPGPGLG